MFTYIVYGEIIFVTKTSPVLFIVFVKFFLFFESIFIK